MKVLLAGWLLLAVGWLGAVVFMEAEQRRERRRELAALRRTSANGLVTVIRPTLQALSQERTVADVVNPLLTPRLWTDAALRVALHDLEVAMRAHGFCRGDIRSWQNSWYFESPVRDVVAVLAERLAGIA